MTIHYVFDCTTASTRKDRRVQSLWLAKVLAAILSRMTGRMHDYEAAARYHATASAAWEG